MNLADKKVLTDEKGNVILQWSELVVMVVTKVFHFISIERSALVECWRMVLALKNTTPIKLPGDANYPKAGETNKDTFVNFFRQDTKFI